MKKKYIKPIINIDPIESDVIMTGSVYVTVSDMEYACGCTCASCNTGNHHPQTYASNDEYCDYYDDLNDPFFD